MTIKPSRILFILASLLLVALGISKLGLPQSDLGAVGREELDTIPPPPPADLILDKPTIIGFLRDSLYLDSIKEHLGEEDFYVSMDDYMWYTYKLLETSTAEGIELVWEYGSDLTFFVPGHADVLWLKRDPSVLYQYYYFDGDSLVETNVFLEGTPLENYEVESDSIEIDPTVYMGIPGAEVENNRQQWWYDDCAECLKFNDTLALDMNGNGASEFIFWDLGYCTSLVIREAGADDIRIGCNIQWQNNLPETVDWVNLWYRITEQEVFETTFDDNEILGECKVKLDNYGFYIGEAEAGGGVIGYVDGQLVYLHQGC